MKKSLSKIPVNQILQPSIIALEEVELFSTQSNNPTTTKPMEQNNFTQNLKSNFTDFKETFKNPILYAFAIAVAAAAIGINSLIKKY